MQYYQFHISLSCKLCSQVVEQFILQNRRDIFFSQTHATHNFLEILLALISGETWKQTIFSAKVGDKHFFSAKVGDKHFFSKRQMTAILTATTLPHLCGFFRHLLSIIYYGYMFQDIYNYKIFHILYIYHYHITTSYDMIHYYIYMWYPSVTYMQCIQSRFKLIYEVQFFIMGKC